MRKMASIDIGTNSMRLLIAEGDTELKNRRKYINITRLGHGVDHNGYIDDETMERNLKALYEFVQVAKREQIDEIEVIGTSALRDSKNRQEFIDRARILSGVNVKVIEGAEEARLGFYGAITGLKKKGYILLIDIGGGSTEFILGSYDEGILFLRSVDIGAVRLTEKFIGHSDPVSEILRDEMRGYILNEIRNIFLSLKKYQVDEVIGIGGTITTFSAMIQGMKEYDMEKIHHSRLNRKQVEETLAMLANKSLEERMMVDGLQPKRADIIVAGGMILSVIMDLFSIENMMVSEYDNLEGALYSRFGKPESKNN